MNHIKNKRVLILSAFYFLSYIVFGMVMSQFTPYLASIGYSEWQRGLMLSSYAITTILFQIFLGVLADRHNTIKHFAIGGLCIVVLTASVFFFPKSPQIMIHFIMIAICGGLVNTCCGLYDTWILSSDESVKSSLSFTKAFGSIGWGTGSAILAVVLNQFGYRALSIIVIIIGSLAVLVGFKIRDINGVKVRKGKINKGDYGKLLADKRYLLLVAILFLMYSVIICNNTAVVDKMISLNASSSQIALKWSIQSFIEIPTYLSGVYLLKKVKHYTLLKICAIAMIIQFCVYSYTQNINVIIAFGAMQMFTTPLLLITSKTMVFDFTPDHMKSSGQLFALSIFTGLSSLIVPTGAGLISSKFGVSITLITAVFFAVSAFLLLFVLEKTVRAKADRI